ncbi:fused MFS/spermidine synthase, partial [bacterium]|nr:fused MFS/spermidine synthase [bacterium]
LNGVALFLFIIACVSVYLDRMLVKKKSILWFIFLILLLFSLIFGYGAAKNGDGDVSRMLYQKDSAYYRIRVADAPLPDGKYARMLFLDADVHSIQPKNDNGAVFYTDSYPIFGSINSNIKSIHVIGAGAYTLPKAFADYYRDAKITVSEIDPDVESIAEAYFGLDTSQIHTSSYDPRYLFRVDDASYDLIFGDAYSSFISVPWHLLTFEWNELVKKRLNKDGIYAVSVVSSVAGENSLLLQSVYKTFSRTFPNNAVLSFSSNVNTPQNIVLVGSLSQNPIGDTVAVTVNNTFSKKAASVHMIDINLLKHRDGVLLTDNFAPVERITLPVVKNYFPAYFDFSRKILGDTLIL